MKLIKKKSSFFKRGFDKLINVIFVAVLLTIAFGMYNLLFWLICKIPNLDSYIGNLITAGVTLALAIVSYFTKIRKYLTEILYKIKQEIYIVFLKRYNFFLSFAIENYNINKHLGTTEQADIINSAINVLKNNKQNAILISSIPGKGKTTTSMLLLDVIAHDKELYNLFIELQHRITYFDSIKDYKYLLYCLNHPETQKDNVIIIDNIQKYTIVVLNEMMKRIKIMTSFAQEKNKKVLFILMYQKMEYNQATYEYIRNEFFGQHKNSFTLTNTLNQEALSKNKKIRDDKSIFEEFDKNISNLKDQSLRNNLESLLDNCIASTFIEFINQLLFVTTTDFTHREQEKIYVLASIIFVCYYYGYVTKDILIMLWEKEHKLTLRLRWILYYYIRNNILIPFPFIRSSFIFNEQLAREYKKQLVKNESFMANIYSIAEYMFTEVGKANGSMKWLFFISCSPEFCVQYPQELRIQCFEETSSTHHLQYMLDILEMEIAIYPEKKEIFRQEIGIMYIRNGEWKKSKNILYPYINKRNINKDIWQIQLKIIEAEHGSCDDDNLEMLDCMEQESTDPLILFQIKYWREHILMEHGRFSLDNWKNLVEELTTSDKILLLKKDNHFSTRVVSDYERTYYLKGNIDYSKYKDILNLYSVFNRQNTDSLEALLSRAYYIQYNIIDQLGIWGCIEYSDIEPDIIAAPTLVDCSNTLETLVAQAVDIYDTCISKYKSVGKKKYRTLQIRRAELTLCMDSGQYINVLSKYDEFEIYAQENGITVFEGYCATQKGKAFALYAMSEFQKGKFDKSDEFLKKAETCLATAKETYRVFGNDYGELRAMFLVILVNMIQERYLLPKKRFEEKFNSKLSELLSNFDVEQKYIREYNIIQYMKNNICKITLPIDIIRYYPIILQ